MSRILLSNTGTRARLLAIAAIGLMGAPAALGADPATRSAPTITVAGALPRTGAVALSDLLKLEPMKAPFTSRRAR